MKKWLRWGCLVLLVLAGVLVVWAAYLFGTAALKTRGEEVITASLHRELEGAPTAAPGKAVAGEAVPDGLDDLPRTLAPRGTLDPGALPPAAGSPAARVVLDFSVGEFRIEPGRPGEGIRVEANYDRNSYELLESFEQGGDGVWTYRVSFRETGLFRDGGLRTLFGAAYPSVVVRLPPDLPLAVEGHFARGGTEFAAGGLWLTELDVTAEKGGFFLGFAEPTVEPLERLAVDARQGGAALVGIGNASPRELRARHRMGGMLVDLGGDWRQDADVEIQSSMSSLSIRLPDHARTEWVGGGRHVSVEGIDQPDPPAPTLKMSVRKWIGPLRILPGPLVPSGAPVDESGG